MLLSCFFTWRGVSSWMWNKQIQYFDQYHCVTVDLPEQGGNKSNDIFSIEDSAYRMIEILKRLSNGKPVIVVGFSLGAQVLVKILSLEPDIIDYSIINSALVIPMKGKAFIEPMIKLFFPLIKNRTFSKLQARTLYIGEENFGKYYNETKDMSTETLVRILKENMVFELPEGFNKAKRSILVTVGAKEKSMMKKSATIIADSNSNCTGITISNIFTIIRVQQYKCIMRRRIEYVIYFILFLFLKEGKLCK